MGLWHVHAQIHRLLQQKYGPYFWTGGLLLQKFKQDWILHARITKMLLETFFAEAHAVLPQENSKGNTEFEGWINRGGHHSSDVYCSLELALYKWLWHRKGIVLSARISKVIWFLSGTMQWSSNRVKSQVTTACMVLLRWATQGVMGGWSFFLGWV